MTRDLSPLMVTLAWFPPHTTLAPHVHDHPTFAVMLEGTFDLGFTSPGIRRRTLPCPPGTILTEPPGEKHANHLGPRGARVMVIQPDLQAADLPTACMRFLRDINHFRDAPISGMAWRIAREVEWPDDVSRLAIEGLALEMLAEAARLGTRSGNGTHGRPRWLDRAVEFVHDRYRGAIRIRDIAAEAGVHPAHLASVFRRVHRMPLGSYVRRLRVDWAAERLLRTDDPISFVAAGAGFADQAHLTRSFKRLTGTTPAAFRQSRRA